VRVQEVLRCCTCVGQRTERGQHERELGAEVLRYLLCCAVLCCAVLCCAVLCCTVVYCAVV